MFGELLNEEFLSDFVDAFYLFFFIISIIVFLWIYLIFCEVYIVLFSEFFDRISKVYPLYFLHKSQQISALSTSKAFENLLAWRYDKGGGFFIVERTVTRKICSCSFEGHISADN